MRQEQDKDTEPSSPGATGSSLGRGAATALGTPGALAPTALEPGPTADGAEGAQEGTGGEHRTQEQLGQAWKRTAGSSRDTRGRTAANPRGSAARSARSRGSSGAFAAVLALGFVCFLSLQTYLDTEAETEGTLEKEGHIPAPSF